MIQSIAAFVVNKPLNILAIAAALAICWSVMRFASGLNVRHANAMLVPVVGFVLYAAWEWLVMVRSPEANIRVDLMVIWPVLLILTTWSFYRACH